MGKKITHQADHKSIQAGFTIIELLIATLVFSVVLILITTGILTFTKSYYQGINQSNTQNAARTILDNVSQAIQFSGVAVTSPITPNNGSQGVCVGSQRYSFLLGGQLWDDGTPDAAQHQVSHALMLDNSGLCTGAPAQNLKGTPVAGTELLQPRMRLSNLVVTGLGNGLYKVTVRVVYGDDDLLNNPTGTDASCKVSISGSQYCAQSELSTTVQRRIDN
jgi:prepilin-type N-terminal cleavage/methylation domain-containing protein